MDKLRKPFLIVAAIAALLVVLLESGSGWLTKQRAANADSSDSAAQFLATSTQAKDLNQSETSQLMSQPHPPGLAIPTTALLDGLLLFIVGIIASPFLVTYRISGRIQGIVTLVVSIAVIILAVMLTLAAVAKLLLMVSLFLAAPFGTIAYMIVWGFFDCGGAAAALSLAMLLKLFFLVCLLLAQQRFIENKGLMILILTSLLATLLVGFLHAIVPSFLVSITDDIGAIIVLIAVLIWAVTFLVGSIISIIKVIAP